VRDLADGSVAAKKNFSESLLEWFDTHGRHDLPWQKTLSAYSVWVSEIMLQQTQVSTVIPYFERFMARFPKVDTLAGSSLDDVLAHWSGLGYYARARNLHKAAGIVRDQHHGEMPDEFEALIELPGIGRSTAGAILSIAFDQRHPILDGNVKRVLTRRAGIGEWPGKTAVMKELWEIADELTPNERVADYTQAIMDLGATLCTRARPLCMHCPVSTDCRARMDGLQDRIPAPKPKKTKPRRSVRMLVLQDDTGAILLEKRPPSGIWAGLYSLPELPKDASIDDWIRDYIGARITNERHLDKISHSFTHFDLDIQPLLAQLGDPCATMEAADRLWYKPGRSQRPGMPAPVSRLLESL
jgi:A/G-specific adenine glycosylase